MFSFYLKSATRSIRRKKIFSSLNVIGLAIGISVFLLTLEYYSYETGFNRFHKNLPHLYRVNTSGEGGKSASTVPNIAPMIQHNIPGVKQAIRFADNFNNGAIISYQPGNDAAGRKTFREEGCVFVDKAFLDAFSFPFIEGTNQLDKTNTVVITSSVAKKIFGNETAVGKTLQLHNQFGMLSCKVSGVIQDPPLQSDIRFDYLFPIETLNNPGYTEGSNWAKLDNWGNSSYTTFVWLDKQANAKNIAAAASELLVKNNPNYKKEDGVIELQPVSELHLGSSMQDDNPVYGSRAMVYFILSLGILVLCIAWINYINFSTAYALSQAKNIGIHKIVGSAKKQIVIRYIAESLLLNLISLLLAFLMVTFTQGLFNYLTAKPLSFDFIKNFHSILTGMVILSAGILSCGAYVGWVLSKFKPVAAIRFNDKVNTGSTLLRKGLVVFQFIISILFIACTIIAYRQIQFMKHHDLGMDIENLVVINGPQIRDSFTKAKALVFKNELLKLPFIEKLSLTGSVPGLGSGHNFGADGITKQNASKEDENKNYSVSEIDENYFDTYKIRFLNGGNFTSADAEKSFKGDHLVINETAAKQLGFNNPADALNQTINWGKQYQVIGVIRDYHHVSLKEKIEPIIYVPQHNNNCYTIKTDLSNLRQKMAAVKKLYETTYPGNPFTYQVLKDTYDLQYADEQRAGVIALSISVLVILIACLGLTGLSLFTAKRRTKEIGIRKILGANTASLFALLSKEFLGLVLIACLVATPLAYILMNKWLLNFAYHADIAWWVFLIAGLMSVLIALITVSFQALKAAVANPVKSLRTE